MPGRAGEWAVRRSWPFAVAKEALLFGCELGLSSQGLDPSFLKAEPTAPWEKEALPAFGLVSSGVGLLHGPSSCLPQLEE